MITTSNIYYRSLMEMKVTKKLVFSAMLLSMVVVLKTIGFNNDYIKVGLNTIPSYLAYQILGPVGGFIFAACSDILGVFVLGQAVNPGITLAAGLSGFIMGLALYGPKISVPKYIIGVIVKTLLCSIILNTFFIALYYFPLGDPLLWDKYTSLVTARLIKNAIQVPLTTILYFVIEQALERVGLFTKLNQKG